MAVLSDISSIGKQLTDTLVRLHLWMEYEGTHGVQTLNFIQEAKKKKRSWTDFPFKCHHWHPTTSGLTELTVTLAPRTQL